MDDSNESFLISALPIKWEDIMLWVIIGLLFMCIAVIIFTDSAEDWPEVREMSDPMVISHLFAIIPLILAWDKKLPLTTATIISSTVISFFYHLFSEDDGSPHLVHVDVTFSGALFVLGCVILLVTKSIRHDVQMWWGSLALGVAALTCYVFAGYNILDHDESTFEQQRERLHPLWHFLAYSALAVVLFNFHRDATTRYSRTKWVRRIQQFSF